MKRQKVYRALPPRRRSPGTPISVHDPWGGLRAHAIHRAHETLDEVPAILRRLKMFLLVAAITMAAFAAGMVAILWRAAR